MIEEQKTDNEPVLPGKIDATPGYRDEEGLQIYFYHDGFFGGAMDNEHLRKSFARENLPAVITKDVISASRGKSKYWR